MSHLVWYFTLVSAICFWLIIAVFVAIIVYDRLLGRPAAERRMREWEAEQRKRKPAIYKRN
jgi:hypothetical protein